MNQCIAGRTTTVTTLVVAPATTLVVAPTTTISYNIGSEQGSVKMAW